MKRETLVDFFDDRIRSSADFLVYDDGYRTYTYSYDHVREAANDFAHRLVTAGLECGQKVVLWGENRPEWVVATWGCLLARLVLVPVDYRASTDLLQKVVSIVDAVVVVVGEEVPPLRLEGTLIWPLASLMTPTRPPQPKTPVGRIDVGRSASEELAEIIFTSGATAEPKGVQLTHHNILANIVPVEREVMKYRKYGRPFFPLRFLNLLPLSHMFGQAMATFVPPMLNGVTVFMRGYNPADIIRQVRSRRVSVIVCVPKMLEVLREHLTRVAPEVLETPSGKEHVAWRWWRYRRVHRLFGFKFWAFVVGAAPLEPELEAFWSRLGFLVIQGYGLTETAPIVTLNHPFRARQGTVGTPIGGVEIRIAPDGEILVRGDNVSSGYYNAPHETAEAFDDGWFRTGDIGTVDGSGRLSVRGRKKEMIVTPEGLNVFPEDVERVLLDVTGVRDAAVVGVTSQGREHVHAVLVLDRDVDSAHVIRDVNVRLEDHQKVRGFTVWPDEKLPRTDGTQKLKRRELRRWVQAGAEPVREPSAGDSDVSSVVQRFAPGRPITTDTTLDELGLSSIERIELMMALERAFDRSIDEVGFAQATTVRALEALVADTDTVAVPAGPYTPTATAFEFPRWNQTAPARLIRQVGLTTFLLPLTRVFAWISVEGLDRLAPTTDPVVYAANHQSHMDGPVILASMPAQRRNRIATAAGKEFFAAHFHPERFTRVQWFTNSLNYYLSTLMFNVFPLPQREAGTRDAIRYLGELVGAGTSVLIFPEGRRTATGEIDRFQPGIGMIASRLRVPVVPVRIEGLDRVLHQSWRMARPGHVRVAFGDPLHLTGEDYGALARQVEDAVRAL